MFGTCGEANDYSLGEKPQIEAERVGRLTKPLKSSAAVDHAWARPVKVSFESRVVASRILTLSRNLKQSAQFNKLFISPDWTPEQRQQRRDHAAKLREKLEADPDRRYFIRGAWVHSEDMEAKEK